MPNAKGRKSCFSFLGTRLKADLLKRESASLFFFIFRHDYTQGSLNLMLQQLLITNLKMQQLKIKKKA